ncbi:MAG: hypothetical protein JW839_08895 [Candidatus Lokiarchaeota archaeon]|nr:hypothetical protein [Candidatus Lokiarchaeota archaeon]
MRALVAYFSLTGRTKRVAEAIASQLSNYAVDIEGITFTGTRRDLVDGTVDSIAAGNWTHLSAKETIFDLEPYDLVCIGMPIHGGRPAVAFNAYVKRCKGFAGKRVCTFVTCSFYPGKSLSAMGQALDGVGAVAGDQMAFRGLFRIGTAKPAEYGRKVNGS